MLVGIPPYYNENINMLYQNIEKGKLKMPKYLSAEAKKLLTVRLFNMSHLYRECFTRIRRRDPPSLH